MKRMIAMLILFVCVGGCIKPIKTYEISLIDPDGKLVRTARCESTITPFMDMDGGVTYMRINGKPMLCPTWPHSRGRMRGIYAPVGWLLACDRVND